MSDVKIIRLQTGEDVIGKIVKKDNDITQFNKAFVIIPHQKAPGQPVQLMMTPYMPYAKEDTIEISTNKIVTIVDPKEEILSSYKKNTSSILTPNSNLITETKLPKLS
jgi:hypothetical protein